MGKAGRARDVVALINPAHALRDGRRSRRRSDAERCGLRRTTLDPDKVRERGGVAHVASEIRDLSTSARHRLRETERSSSCPLKRATSQLENRMKVRAVRRDLARLRGSSANGAGE